MGVFNVGIFSKPRYSAFPWNHNNKFSTKTGVIKPIATEFLNTGDKFDLNDISAICRQAPLLAPTLDTHYMDIHAFALRLRSLGNACRDPWVYEDFFNLNVNTDGSKSLPCVGLGQLFSVNGLKTGTLYESLGFPIFVDLRKDILEWVRKEFPIVFETGIDVVDIRDDSALGSYPVGVYLAPRNLGLVGPHVNKFYDSDDSLAFSFESYPVSYANKLATSVRVGSSRQFSRLSSNAASPFYFCNVNQFAGEDLSGNDDYFEGVPYTLVKYCLDKYPEILPEYVRATFPYTVSASAWAAMYLGAPDPDDELADILDNYIKTAQWLSEELPSFSVLDKVYEVYGIDSEVVLAEFTEEFLQRCLDMCNYSLYDSDHGFNAAWHDEDGVFSGLYKWFDSEGTDHSRHIYSLFAYVLERFSVLFPLNLNIGISAVTELAIPSYFIDSYSKILADWYINTAIQSPDTFFASRKVGLDSEDIEDEIYTAVCGRFATVNELYYRLWKNDYFTSAFPSPQAGQAVGIPVNGTIVDLRNANAMQKLKERLLYAGNRFRDVLYAITGKKTSSAILEMSEVIGSWSLTINVDSVLQNSQSNENKPLASYGGTGLGYRSGGKGCSYTAEEPTIIMFLCSIRPQASYFQGLNRKFWRSNVYDYAIPQLANVGEQQVYKGELCCLSDFLVRNATDAGRIRVFGWQRRNGDFMWTPNEVHGDFQTSLDFWHNSRKFDSNPSLNIEFLQVRPEQDDLNRIFAVKSDSIDKWYCRVDFEGQVIRSLPKHVHYDL